MSRSDSNRPTQRQGAQSVRDPLYGQAERILLVGVNWPSVSVSLSLEYLDELELLAQTAGGAVAGRELAKRDRPDPATMVGKGKVAELAEMASDLAADLIVFDEDLSPAQARNLENGIGRRIIDRTGLILDIFARRARTREAKTQVELAQLRYLLPRLTRAWTHLERQQGGIGLRGPGETQLETDRRVIRTRIKSLETDLHHIERIRKTQRAGRTDVYRFALAGYTNVGKSCLMNALTGAGVFEENLLFATLDSTTRMVSLGSQARAVLTDTVGFIRKLPPALVASFRSTLAEIAEADCIVHVVDLSSIAWREQMDEVTKILAEMNLSQTPTILLFNKIDIITDDEPHRRAIGEFPDAILISAKTGSGIPALAQRMRAVVLADQIDLAVTIKPRDGKLLANIYRFSETVEETQSNNKLNLKIRISRQIAERLGLLKYARVSSEATGPHHS